MLHRENKLRTEGKHMTLARKIKTLHRENKMRGGGK
jgi:hypothetical protein